MVNTLINLVVFHTTSSALFATSGLGIVDVRGPEIQHLPSTDLL